MRMDQLGCHQATTSVTEKRTPRASVDLTSQLPNRLHIQEPVATRPLKLQTGARGVPKDRPVPYQNGPGTQQ